MWRWHWRHRYSRAEFGLVISKSYLNFLSKIKVLVFTPKKNSPHLSKNLWIYALQCFNVTEQLWQFLPGQDNKVCVCLLSIPVSWNYPMWASSMTCAKPSGHAMSVMNKMHVSRSGSKRFASVPKREPLYPDWASQHSLVLEEGSTDYQKKA